MILTLYGSPGPQGIIMKCSPPWSELTACVQRIYTSKGHISMATLHASVRDEIGCFGTGNKTRLVESLFLAPWFVNTLSALHGSLMDRARARTQYIYCSVKMHSSQYRGTATYICSPCRILDPCQLATPPPRCIVINPRRAQCRPPTGQSDTVPPSTSGYRRAIDLTS